MHDKRLESRQWLKKDEVYLDFETDDIVYMSDEKEDRREKVPHHYMVILDIMSAAPNRRFTYEQIISMYQNYEEYMGDEKKTLRDLMANIRALDSEILTIKVIASIRNVGYRFVPPEGCERRQIAIDEQNTKVDLNGELFCDESILSKTREKIATYYWNLYSTFEILSNEFDVLKIFIYPEFSDNKTLNITCSKKNYLIEAPNSFGKSTFMKSILLSLNYEEILSDGMVLRKINEVRQRIGLSSEERYLTLFLDVNNVQGQINVENNKEDILKWLYDITMGDIGAVDEKAFNNIVKYYGEQDKLILLVDGFDEVDDNTRDELVKMLNECRKLRDIGGNLHTLIATRPILMRQNYRQSYFQGFEKIGINALKIDRISVETYIQNYMGYSNENVTNKIINSRFLKSFVTTPHILSMLIVVLSTSNKKNYQAISMVLKNMINRFTGDNMIDNREADLDAIKLIYQEMAFFMVTTGNQIINLYEDFEILIRRTAENLKSLGYYKIDKILGEQPIFVADIYTHHSLIVTTGNIIEFISPDVLIPYFVAGYLARFFYKEFEELIHKEDDENVLNTMHWEVFSKFEEIEDKYICDTLSFLLIIMMNPREYSSRINNFRYEHESVFLKSLLYYLKNICSKEIVVKNINGIAHDVYSDEILGAKELSHRFYDNTGVKMEELDKYIEMV